MEVMHTKNFYTENDLKKLIFALPLFCALSVSAQKVDYSVVSVPEEAYYWTSDLVVYDTNTWGYSRAYYRGFGDVNGIGKEVGDYFMKERNQLGNREYGMQIRPVTTK